MWGTYCCGSLTKSLGYKKKVCVRVTLCASCGGVKPTRHD